MLEKLKEIKRQFEKEAALGLDSSFLCCIAKELYGILFRMEFEKYLIDNYPGGEFKTKEMFEEWRGVVFSNDSSRVKWLDNQIKIEEENEKK
jgi:hypothetical protein